jgi:hypothetical protein
VWAPAGNWRFRRSPRDGVVRVFADLADCVLRHSGGTVQLDGTLLQSLYDRANR